MADKTTGKLKLWLAKITDKISDTINIYLSENFSKIDDEFSSLKDDLTAHKAEMASKHIKESGSNENGSYIKFDDGTMIGYKKFPNLDIEVPVNEYVDIIFPYPATFINANSEASVSYGGFLSDVHGFPRKGLMNVRVASDSIKLTVLNFDTKPIDQVRGFSFLIIGRWK